jgi:hypothetical protein
MPPHIHTVNSIWPAANGTMQNAGGNYWCLYNTGNTAASNKSTSSFGSGDAMQYEE